MSKISASEKILARVIVLFGILSLTPNFYRELSSAWDRGEFYFTTFSQILFFIGLYFYTRKNILSPYWQRKYLINSTVLVFLLFYLYGSTFYDPSFPTLGILFIYSIAFFLIMSIFDLIVTLVTNTKSPLNPVPKKSSQK